MCMTVSLEGDMSARQTHAAACSWPWRHITHLGAARKRWRRRCWTRRRSSAARTTSLSLPLFLADTAVRQLAEATMVPQQQSAAGGMRCFPRRKIPSSRDLSRNPQCLSERRHPQQERAIPPANFQGEGAMLQPESQPLTAYFVLAVHSRGEEPVLQRAQVTNLASSLDLLPST